MGKFPVMRTTIATKVLTCRLLNSRAFRLAPSRPRSHKSISTGRRAIMAAASTQKLDVNTPDSTWREVLGTQEYRILRQKGTEAPCTSQRRSSTADVAGLP